MDDLTPWFTIGRCKLSNLVWSIIVGIIILLFSGYFIYLALPSFNFSNSFLLLGIVLFCFAVWLIFKMIIKFKVNALSVYDKGVLLFAYGETIFLKWEDILEVKTYFAPGRGSNYNEISFTLRENIQPFSSFWAQWFYNNCNNRIILNPSSFEIDPSEVYSKLEGFCCDSKKLDVKPKFINSN